MTPNPVRVCIGCGLTDDHPRHEVVIDANMTSVPWHFDCHSRATGCELCTPVIEAAGGKTGEALRKFLQKGK